MKKKYFKVQAKVTSYCYIHVEAADSGEAYRKAKDIDGGQFITEDDNTGEWEVLEPEEIKKEDVEENALID